MSKDRDARETITAVAAIVHAAGVSRRLSLQTAEAVFLTVKEFLDSKTGQDYSAQHAERCTDLRSARLARRRELAAERMTQQISPQVYLEPDKVKTITGYENKPSKIDNNGFATWMVHLCAELTARIGAGNSQQAISLAAQRLPQHITLIEAKQVAKF